MLVLHRFVRNKTNCEVVGYNIFERIVKESMECYWKFHRNVRVNCGKQSYYAVEYKFCQHGVQENVYETVDILQTAI